MKLKGTQKDQQYLNCIKNSPVHQGHQHPDPSHDQEHLNTEEEKEEEKHVYTEELPKTKQTKMGQKYHMTQLNTHTHISTLFLSDQPLNLLQMIFFF